MNVLLKVHVCEFTVFGVLFSVKEEGSVVLEDRLQLAVQVGSVLLLLKGSLVYMYTINILASMLRGFFHVSFR